jgi:hypothetical protein
MTVPSVGLRLRRIGDGPERSRPDGRMADLGLQATVRLRGRAIADLRDDRLILAAGPATLLASVQERAGPFAMDRTA